MTVTGFAKKLADMNTLIHSSLVRLGYKAIANGVRLPTVKIVNDFHQWARLMDLTRRLSINVFLDVGANRGFFSKHLRMAGYTGRLISFEPILEDYERIKVLAANDLKWTPCCYALGAKSETKKYQVNTCNNETVLSSFLSLKQQFCSSRSVEVEIHRLDEYCRKNRPSSSCAS
jgi:FkbM family methyltransferase